MLTMRPIKDALDLRKAEKIAEKPHHHFWQRGPAPKVFVPRRSEALGIYMQATELPLELPRAPWKHEEYAWIQVVPHGITPKGVVYADLWQTLEVHQSRVAKLPSHRWWRCQGMMLVTGAPRCDYVTVYPESSEEALKRAKHRTWAKHGRAWTERKVYYQIHEVKPDAEAFKTLLENALAIHRMVKSGEKEREITDEVRAELISRSWQTASEGAENRA